MKFEEFEKIINDIKSCNDKEHKFYNLNLDISNITDDYHKIISMLLKSYYYEEGADWIDWFLYERENFDGTLNKAYDKDENEICNNLKELWEIIEIIRNDKNNIEYDNVDKKREDGPIEYDNGDKLWYVNDKLHREDGPAIEYANGDKFWYKDGNFHREDGPAIENGNGDKEWYKNGIRHREDVPAIEYVNGDKEWYLNDKYYTEKEYQIFLREKKLNRIL